VRLDLVSITPLDWLAMPANVARRFITIPLSTFSLLCLASHQTFISTPCSAIDGAHTLFVLSACRSSWRVIEGTP
jgi:hypothetical protein